MSKTSPISREYDIRPAKGFKRVIRWFRRKIPRGLYARTLLIIILPMVLLQSVIVFIVMERHWQTVTKRLSTAVTRDISATIDLIETYPLNNDYTEIVRIARERLALNIAVEPLGALPKPRTKPFFSILDRILSEEINKQIKKPFWIDTVGNSNLVEIRIKLENNILRVFAKRSQAYASNTHIFIFWMLGTSVVLLIISVLFLRGQIRPILSLTKAAETFGKGQREEANFKPRGADEIRRAGYAFLQMRERIERQLEQRTAMLTGVSHDLRTILTRFKLQLAIAGDTPEIENLNQDVEDMQSMLEGYLSFARGEAEEDVGTINFETLLLKIKDDAILHQKKLTTQFVGYPIITVRPNAFTRLVDNITANAFRYAQTIKVSANHSDKWMTITVDDDGPGIDPASHEDVFKPFFRLDEARNLDETGTGLGLAIARDIARSHGGDITLSKSSLSGLCVKIRIPA